MKDLLKGVYIIRALFNFIKRHLLVSLHAVDISLDNQSICEIISTGYLESSILQLLY